MNNKYLTPLVGTIGAYVLGFGGGNLSTPLLTTSLYLFNRIGNVPKLTSALYAAGAVCAGELAQKVGLLPGTYDPKDFIAAGATASLALLIDKLYSKIKEKEEAIIEYLEND